MTFVSLEHWASTGPCLWQSDLGIKISDPSTLAIHLAYACLQAYGKLLGTLLVSTLIPSILSFFPVKLLRKV